MIGVLHHPKIARSQPLADEIAAWLQTQGQDVWRDSVWEKVEIEAKIGRTSHVVVLGGDGSILRVARIAAPYDVPIFSVNLGNLGFLTESSAENWQPKLTQLLTNDYRLERRLMLKATVERDSRIVAEQIAVNEVVVGRGRQARVLRFRLSVDDHHVTSYVADGLITATPTGSTAYALAAGGPILPPELPNFLVVPVAPHLTLDRAIVLYADSIITLTVHFDHEATLTTDGQEAFDLCDGDRIIIQKAPYTSAFVRTDDPSYFYQRLTTRRGGLRRD